IIRELTKRETESTPYGEDVFDFGPGMWVDEVGGVFRREGYSFKRVGPRTYSAIPREVGGHIAYIVVQPQEGRGIVKITHTSPDGPEKCREQIAKIRAALARK